MVKKRTFTELVVCDHCGLPGETVTVQVEGEPLDVDLCQKYRALLIQLAEIAAKYGRKHGEEIPVIEEQVSGTPARHSRGRRTRHGGSTPTAPMTERLRCGVCGDEIKRGSRHTHARRHDKVAAEITWIAAA